MGKRDSGKRKKYMAAALAVSVLVLACLMLRAVMEDWGIQEYSDRYVAMAELPSQLSFTYYGEEEWKEKLKELKGRNISVSFLDNRHVTHPPMRRKGQPTDFSSLPEFYVLSAVQGYFVKRSSRHIWFARNQKPTNPGIRKFKTEKAAQKYLDDNQAFFSKYAFQIECVQNGGVPA